MTLTSAEQSSIATARRVDPAAYDAYLRGRHFWNKRTRDDLVRAADYFRAAIDRDPTYAPAYAGLADAYALLGTIGYDALRPAEAMPRAGAAARRALELDEGLGGSFEHFVIFLGDGGSDGGSDVGRGCWFLRAHESPLALPSA